ncbi:lantibiotic protection ABC transporter ATP-binding subunit [Streptococcus marmotae]|uniref:lantibiotic protection ABC transporter ATP-binding subunit n=1 Tax=Streptococcus marmotae TaxID=1825069 RepID=UPI00082BC0D4|nr:lantibiotic protection ABC transporter ATP-binding subunit [Streptococcus marmotae]
MTILLEIKGLTKQYHNQLVLNQVSIQVEKGTVYGLLGPNGAGKSTLLKLITRTIPKTSGEILFENHPLEVSDLRRIGAIIEHPAIYPNLTAYENLEVLATLLQIEKARINEVLMIVSLSQTGKKLVKEFSLGMKQRLGIAMALLNHPSLLILDEPTNGLDPLGIQELRELIRSLSQEGMTIILSSHILSEVQQVADKIGIINQGHVSYEGENSTSQAELENLFMEIIKREGVSQ